MVDFHTSRLPAELSKTDDIALIKLQLYLATSGDISKELEPPQTQGGQMKYAKTCACYYFPSRMELY